MKSVLIAGVDGVAGANLAAALSDSCRVSGIAWKRPAHLAQGRAIAGSFADLVDVQRLFAQVQPDMVVFCGAGAQSTWFESPKPTSADVELARVWAAVARDRRCGFTMISSDAVFTGPWMFHSEKSASFCNSPGAEFLRQAEETVTGQLPESLVVRTHAFGWSPYGDGWFEELLEKLQDGESPELPLECSAHASPLLVQDLAMVLAAAWEKSLNGLYHVGGAERVNPAMFATRLADVFCLPTPKIRGAESLATKTEGFGRGETSLQTRRIRRELGVSLPLLNDSLVSLYQQHLNGYRDVLMRTTTTRPVRVA